MAPTWHILCYLIWFVRPTIEVDNLSVLELLSSIKEQDTFNYLLLMKQHNTSISLKFMANEKDNCFARSLMERLQTSVMQLDERVNYFLFQKQASRLLSIVYLVGNDLDQHESLLKTLVTNLRLITTSRVVFLIELAEANENFLKKLFLNCWKMKLLNVLAVFEDYALTNTFYGYTHFPNFKLEQRKYEAQLDIFPQRLSNLHGYHLPVIVGGTHPRTISYYNRNGDIVYGGTVGHFLKVFQQKYNCIFIEPYPFKPNVTIPSNDLMLAVRNGTVEISLAVTFPETLSYRGFSYPYEQMHWCLMLPVEPDVAPAEYYVMVFELQAFLLTLLALVLISISLALALRHHGYEVQPYEFVLHENCLRGALGQSFYEVFRAPLLVRGIYLNICILGILLTAWYNSYFSAYVTSSPKELPYRSYDDVLASNLKVVAWKPEYDQLIGRLAEFRKYAPMFLVEPSFGKYISMRDSFNTKYGYMMTTTKWVVINAQQNVFSKPLFRMRDDFCFFNNIPLGLPVHENSIYMEPIQSLILDLAAMGLTSHWTANGFAELVEAGELHFVDLTPHREFRAMQLQDLQYIWYGFAFMAVLSSTVFCLELFWGWMERRQKLTKCLQTK